MKSTALPVLLSEYQIRSFKYYWEDHLHCGMTFDGRLYALLSSFEAEERALAYEKGCQLAARADDVVVTVSRDIRPLYRLWIALSPKNCELLRTDKRRRREDRYQNSTWNKPGLGYGIASKPETAFLSFMSNTRFLQYVKI